MNQFNVDSKEWKEKYGSLCEESFINRDQRRFMFDSMTYAIKGIAAELGINYYYTLILLMLIQVHK